MDKPAGDFTHIETMLMQGLSFTAVLESAKLGLFDGLDKAPVTPAELAAKHGFEERRTEALLDVLVANGLLSRGSGGYRNTPAASEYLVSTSPYCQIKALELHTMFNQPLEADIPGFLRGKNEMRRATDDGWGTRDTMEGTAQHARMGSLQDAVAFIADLPGFMDMRTMCDIGGNHGEYSIALLDRNPDLTGEIADLPQVVHSISQRIDERGYSKRLTAFACDLRTQTLPTAKYDLILASHVLYGFAPKLDRIAAMVHAALKPGGWFVSQHMNPDGGLPATYSAAVELVTRMAGYYTHNLGRDILETTCVKAGFETIRTGFTGKHDGGLILAAQRR
jgi:SAM-dependent methyltransferase